MNSQQAKPVDIFTLVRPTDDMDGDIPITREQAIALQQQYQHRCLVMWVVTWNASDYRRQAVARPHLVMPPEQDRILRTVLIADSLDALRRLLPIGLKKMDRFDEDDPVITEVWL
jgi:hypothetical protein